MISTVLIAKRTVIIALTAYSQVRTITQKIIMPITLHNITANIIQWTKERFSSLRARFKNDPVISSLHLDFCLSEKPNFSLKTKLQEESL